MKNKIYVTLSFLFVTLCANADYWTQKADFGGAQRADATGFSIGHMGYLGTGYVASYTTDWWEYDPANNTWLQKASYGGMPIVEATGFSIGNKGYILSSPSGNDFWEFDPVANSWTQKAVFPGASRQAPVTFSVGTKGYLGTGTSPLQNDFWEYDQVLNTWTQKANFGGAPRYLAVGFSIGTKGYLGTGYTSGGTAQDFWEYDQPTDTWTQKANVPGNGRNEATGFSLGGFGYLGTGYMPQPQSDFYQYDPSTNIWTTKASFGGGVRVESVSFSIDSLGYLGTGWDGVNFRRDFWEYHPDSIITSVDENLSQQPTVSIYPNPVVQFANVVIGNEINLEKAVCKIYDVPGKEVYTQKISSHNFTINRKNIADGNYFVKLINGEKEFYRTKIILVSR